MSKYKDYFYNGIIANNPVFVQAVGMCPALGVTTSAINGMGMGLATTAVLLASNVFISLLRNIIPTKVRIPAFIVIIATFVTLVQFLLEAFLPELNASLGLFIPLIVVNCLILARAESFASKNNPLDSFMDGLAMGLGFTVALTILGAVREILGANAFFGINYNELLGISVPSTIMMVLAPGAFLSLGFILALINYVRRDK